VLFCQHIKSPSRCVNVAHLAPDLAFADIPKLFNKDLQRTKLIGQGGSGMVYAGVLTLRDGTGMLSPSFSLSLSSSLWLCSAITGVRLSLNVPRLVTWYQCFLADDLVCRDECRSEGAH
jgi:hypothetical protein